MRFPNQRYGHPEDLRYYANFFGDDKTRVKNLAKYLKRDERTIQRWMDGKLRVPWWVPEILRLRHVESEGVLRQMLGDARDNPPASTHHSAPATGEIVVTEEDIFQWVAATSPVHLTDRLYGWYVRRWDVANKVRTAKLDGRFDAIVAHPRPSSGPSIYLPLSGIPGPRW